MPKLRYCYHLITVFMLGWAGLLRFGPHQRGGGAAAQVNCVNSPNRQSKLTVVGFRWQHVQFGAHLHLDALGSRQSLQCAIHSIQV